MKTRLQDQTIKGAQAPANGRLELKDKNVDGLMIRVTPNGAKTFCLVFKIPGEHPCGPSKTGAARKGKPHRMTLGTWPRLSLAEAREQARTLLEQVDQGIDPRPARAQAAHEAYTNTVASVAKRFIAQECKGHIKNWHRVERTLALHVLPLLGNRPIADIERADIHALVDALVDEDREGGPLPGAAREAIKHTHRLFDFAFDRGIIKSNPAHKLKRKVLKANDEAGRPLTDKELRAIWKAAGTLGYPSGDWVRLLMLTGRRCSEWSKATRDELDLGARTHTVPASGPHKYKTGIEHSMPLVGTAWEIVDALPVWNGGDYLFSTTGGRLAINSSGETKKRIDKLVPTDKPWRLHDFRVTCRTRMEVLGVRFEHSEAVLGHVKKGIEKVYNKHEYEAEKRAALELYAAHLMEVVGS